MEYTCLRYLDDKALWDLDKYIYTIKGKCNIFIIMECGRRNFDYSNLYSNVCEKIKREEYKKDKKLYNKVISKIHRLRIKNKGL